MPGPSTSTDGGDRGDRVHRLVGFTEFTALVGDQRRWSCWPSSRVWSTSCSGRRTGGEGARRRAAPLVPRPGRGCASGPDLNSERARGESEPTGMPLWIRIGVHSGAGRERGVRPRRPRRQHRGPHRRNDQRRDTPSLEPQAAGDVSVRLAGSARGFRTSSLLALHWREQDLNSRLPRNRKNADGVRTVRAAGIVWKKELAFRACVIEITPNFE